jgi:hypothetical protein
MQLTLTAQYARLVEKVLNGHVEPTGLFSAPLFQPMPAGL